jgi:hypothetical protein
MSSTKPTTPRNNIAVTPQVAADEALAHRRHLDAAAAVLGQRPREFRRRRGDIRAGPLDRRASGQPSDPTHDM